MGGSATVMAPSGGAIATTPATRSSLVRSETTAPNEYPTTKSGTPGVATASRAAITSAVSATPCPCSERKSKRSARKPADGIARKTASTTELNRLPPYSGWG